MATISRLVRIVENRKVWTVRQSSSDSIRNRAAREELDPCDLLRKMIDVKP